MVSESSSPQFARICLAGWFKLLIMGYPYFCITFLPVLVGCLPIPDGGHRLTKYPDVNCNNSFHDTLVLKAWIGTVVGCFLFPLFLMWVVRMFIQERLTSNLDYILVHNLFVAHKPTTTCMNWRIIMMFRTCSIVAVAFAPFNAWDHAAYISCSLIVTLFFEARIRPRVTSFGNALEGAETCVLMLTVTLCQLYDSRERDQLDNSGFNGKLIEWTTFFMALFFVTFCCLVSVKQAINKYHRVKRERANIIKSGGGKIKKAIPQQLRQQAVKIQKLNSFGVTTA